MTDYYKERKDVRKKEEQEKGLFNKQEKQLCEEDKEKEKISRAANAAKLDEYLKELKRKKYEKKIIIELSQVSVLEKAYIIISISVRKLVLADQKRNQLFLKRLTLK